MEERSEIVAAHAIDRLRHGRNAGAAPFAGTEIIERFAQHFLTLADKPRGRLRRNELYPDEGRTILKPMLPSRRENETRKRGSTWPAYQS